MNKWLEIKNLVENGANKTEIRIYGEIGDWWEGLDANTLTQAIKDAEGDTIEIRMLTYGGSLVTALGVYNVMKASGKKFIIHNDGVIASAGTVIACAGEVHMPRNAMYMIHSALVGAYGNAEELRRIADMLDKFDGGIKSIYADKTDLTSEQIDDLMSTDTWLNADEAKNLGLVDVITENIQIAASAVGKDTVINGIVMPKLDAKNLPKALLNNVKSENNEPNKGGKLMNLVQFKADHGQIAAEFEAEIQAKNKTAVEDAVKAERERIKDIQASAMPGHEAIAAEAIENGWDAGKFAIAALKADKAKGDQYIAARKNDANQVDVPPSDDTPPKTTNAAEDALAAAFGVEVK